MKFSLLILCVVTACACGALARDAKFDAGARARAWHRVEPSAHLWPVAVEDSILASERSQPLPNRIGNWARRFAAADSVVYLFGLRPGGYVATGALVDDRHQDCVSLLYRTTELARARDARDAVDWALRTRFAGADSGVVASDGRVDYDDPAHLDFSLDMIRSGHWGRDITTRLSGATVDTAGSSRYEPGGFSYVPRTALNPAELAEGDVVWFVLDPAREKSAALRRDYGLVIGHIGLIVIDQGQPQLVHAAVSGLAGRYEGGTVVTVPLQVYLARVEKFAGIVVTRFLPGS